MRRFQSWIGICVLACAALGCEPSEDDPDASPGEGDASITDASEPSTPDAAAGDSGTSPEDGGAADASVVDAASGDPDAAVAADAGVDGGPVVVDSGID